MNPTVSPLIGNQSQSLLERRSSNVEVHSNQVSHCERRMAIDLVTMSGQSMVRAKPLINANGVSAEPLTKLHQPSDLIELIKMTNKPSQKAHKLWRSRQFSLTDLDFHPFNLRKLILSLSSKNAKDSSNVSNKSTGKAKPNFCKENNNNQEIFDTCQRVELHSNLDPNVPEQVKEAPYQSTCDTKLDADTKPDLDINVSYNVISTSSSTETIKVEDRISVKIELEKDTSRQLPAIQLETKSPDNIELNSHKLTSSNLSELKSIVGKDYNNVEQPKLPSRWDDEEILETLRRVVRACTKTDLSKRASASEVHSQLEAAIMSSRLARSRVKDQTENEANNWQHHPDSYTDITATLASCPATD